MAQALLSVVVRGSSCSAKATDEIGNPRTSPSNGTISLGAVQPLASGGTSGTAQGTTIVPGDASVNFFGANPSPAFQVPVAVNSDHGGTASGGTLSLGLVSGNTTTSLGSATVGTNGVTTVSVAAGALTANLQAGTYELIEADSRNASFDASDAFDTLTVNPQLVLPSTSIVAGSGSVGFNGDVTIIPVVLNSTAGTVNFDTVTISLVHGLTTFAGQANVSGGAASVLSFLPDGLAPSTYPLIETYTDSSGHFNGSSALGILTVNPPPPSTDVVHSPPPPSPVAAAIEVAIDVVTWFVWGRAFPTGLVPVSPTEVQNIRLRLQFLEKLLELFANRSLPGPAYDPQLNVTQELPQADAALTADIHSLLPLTEDMGLSVIELGFTLATNYGFTV
jgi:hypothetical protein